MPTPDPKPTPIAPIAPKPSEETVQAIALDSISHDNVTYEIGETIEELPKKIFDQLSTLPTPVVKKK